MTGSATATQTLSVALLGAGTVGGELARMLATTRLKHNDGEIGFSVTQALVRNTTKTRNHIRAQALVNRPEAVDLESVDLVVEALGGIEPARTLALRALRAGKPYITANKTLVAYHGDELFEAAQASGAPLRFEAAVGAAAPCIAILRNSLRATRIRRIYGVLNGTSHFILNEIRNPGISLEAAIALAQRKGYAESDPSADLEGHDAAQKLSILAWCIGGSLLDPASISRVELPTLSPEAVAAAAHIGFVVKPLASLSWTKDGIADAWIAPAAVPSGTTVAGTTGAEAAIVVHTTDAGRIQLAAPGAGGSPTASAMFDDIAGVVCASARGMDRGDPGRIDLGGADDPREWVVHLPLNVGFDGASLVKHISLHRGAIERFENLGDSGWIAYVSGISYTPGFTRPLTQGKACVLEVVR